MKKMTASRFLILAMLALLWGCGGSGGSSGNGAGGTIGTVEQGKPSGSPSGSNLNGTANTAPVANAGDDLNVPVGTFASLDGSRSADADGETLSFKWSIVSTPAGSSTSIQSGTKPYTGITPDIPGDYVIQLVVMDSRGLESSPDTVKVSTINSAPVADAGPDQSIKSIGIVVQLTGIDSYHPDGVSITYSWSIKAKPEGSHAFLSSANSPAPTFVADVSGDYVIELIVSDASSASSMDSMWVSFGNLKPVADAGFASVVLIGTTVILDGSASNDPNGDAISYKWNWVYKPEGSVAELSNSLGVTPTFKPDVPGMYVVNLIVNDGKVNSDPSSVSIQAASSADAATQKIMDAIAVVKSFDKSVFKNRNTRRSLLNNLNSVLHHLNQGYPDCALSKLETILKRLDGCTRPQHTPECNDWIIDCAAQGQVYTLLIQAKGEFTLVQDTLSDKPEFGQKNGGEDHHADDKKD